jgi:hypothetical protein
MKGFVMYQNSELSIFNNVSGEAVLDTLLEFRYITKLRRAVSNFLNNPRESISIIYIIYLIRYFTYLLSLFYLRKLQFKEAFPEWER